MDAGVLKTKFARMGARLKLNAVGRAGRRRGLPLTLDIGSDVNGEFFDIQLRPGEDVDLSVIDLRRRERHLLLEARDASGPHLFLCGHDERHWFVAAIPEVFGRPNNVARAMEALKPPEVLEAQRRQGIKSKELRRRKNAAYIRQGEWFFLPAPELRVEKKLSLHDEPLSRGNGSKPHWAEFLYRKGGETVYVCDAYPQGLTWSEYQRVLSDQPRAKDWRWRTMRRNPEAYVKGRISHPDHRTIHLHCWHKVLLNTEGQSRAMAHVVFLD